MGHSISKCSGFWRPHLVQWVGEYSMRSSKEVRSRSVILSPSVSLATPWMTTSTEVVLELVGHLAALWVPPHMAHLQFFLFLGHWETMCPTFLHLKHQTTQRWLGSSSWRMGISTAPLAREGSGLTSLTTLGASTRGEQTGDWQGHMGTGMVRWKWQSSSS